MKKTFTVTLAIILLLPAAIAYVESGGALYCGNSSMNASEVAADCTAALNNNSYSTVYLNVSVTNLTGTFIDDPVNMSNKLFDCQGNSVSGDSSGTWLHLDAQSNNIIQNCSISNFSMSIEFDTGANNNTIRDSTFDTYIYCEGSYNNTIYNSTFRDSSAIRFKGGNHGNGCYNTRFYNNTLIDATIVFEWGSNNVSNNLFLNETSYFTINLDAGTCDNIIQNNIDPDRGTIYFTNISVNWSNINDVALMWICDADNSNLTNITINDAVLYSRYSANLTITQSNFSNSTLNIFSYGDTTGQISDSAFSDSTTCIRISENFGSGIPALASVINNTFTNCGEAVHIEDAMNNTIANNTFINNTVAINLSGGSNNVITGNRMEDNGLGVFIDTFLLWGVILRPADNNLIHYNWFIDNTIQAEDRITTGSNKWNTTNGTDALGNYWCDAFFLDILDADSDGWGDSGSQWPYNVTNGANVLGNVSDNGPNLTKGEAPIITMTSPAEGVTYTTSTVPLMVSANEPIHEWRYSIDGGNNVTFTPNITLELSNANHEITVYAIDEENTVSSTDYDVAGPGVLWDSYDPEKYSLTQGGIAVLSDGKTVVSGRRDEAAFPTYPWIEVYVKLYDTDGTVLWNNMFGEGGADQGWKVHVTQNDEICVAAFDFIGGLNYPWVFCLDTDGNMLWDYLGADAADNFYDVIELASGTIVTTGDRKIFWISDNGTLLSNVTIGVANSGFESVVEASNGDLILGGYTDAYGAGGDDLWIVRTDENGTVLWNTTFGGGSEDEANDLIELQNGDIAVAGFTKSFGAGNSDAVLVRLDENGTHLWNQTFGGTQADTAYTVSEAPDGDLVVAGNTASFGAGGTDTFLVRYTANGTYVMNETFGTANDELFGMGEFRPDGSFALTASKVTTTTDFWTFALKLDGPVAFTVLEPEYGGNSPVSVEAVAEPAPTITQPSPVEVSYSLNEGGDTATITVSNDKIVVDIAGMTLTMPENAFVEVDLDDDGVNDVRITTGSILDGKADVTITELKEEVKATEAPAELDPEEMAKEPVTDPEPALQKETLEQATQAIYTPWPLIVTILAIVIITAMFVLVWKRK